MKRVMKRRTLLLLGILAALAGCGSRADKDVVARFDSGEITRSDIEAFDEAWPSDLTPVSSLEDLLLQGMERGLVPDDVGTYLAAHWPRLFSRLGEDPLQNLFSAPLSDEAIIRQLALERICLERLQRQPERMAGRALPELAGRIHLLFQALEAGQRHFALLSVSEPEVKSFYESHRGDYRVPARVDLRHLFLNSSLYSDRPSRDEPRAVALAEDLFKRLTQGEAFGRLIRRHSDSDTRERGGWILQAQPEALRGEVQEMLQQLDPGEISPPIRTPVGIHLVQLMARHASEEMTFEQVREELESLLLARRREEVYHSIVAEAVKRYPLQVLPEALSDEKDSAVVLRVGEESYSLRDIEEELEALEPAFDQLDELEKTRVITRLAHAALYLKSLEQQPVTHYDALERRFKNRILTEQFLSALAEQRLTGLLEDHRQLRIFFQQRRELYQSPWQVSLSLAEIPLPEPVPQDPIGNYRRRQEQVGQARRLIDQLKEGASESGGEGVERLRWRTQRTARRLEELPQPLRDAIVAFISSHSVAGRLPAVLDQPVEEEGKLLIVRVMELVPARQQSFEESLSRVRGDFAETKKPEIIDGLRDEILREARFRLVVSTKAEK